MLKLSEILYTSIKSTSRQPRWWILAFLQVVALFLCLPIVLRPGLLFSLFVFWPLMFTIISVPATVWLWLDIDARKTRTPRQNSLNFFISACMRTGGLMLFTAAITIVSRVTFGDWVFFALVSSLVAATAILAMLYAVLCEEDFGASLALAVYTWNKKISLAAAVALVLMLVHGLAFALAHGIWQGFSMDGRFSVLFHSATIWILFLGLAVLVSYLAAILNSFLVLLFLELIRRKKDPEAVHDLAPKLVASQAHL